MLTRNERDTVKAKLAALFATGTAQNIVTAIFSAEAAPVLQAIPPAAPSHVEIAVAVLNCCLGDRWARDPSLVEVLLADLVARGSADLAPLRDRVRARIDPNLELLATSWISADRPFFGRATARERVKALLASGSMPILRVDGVTKSGKTYTGDWLNFIAGEDRLDFRIVIEKLEVGSGPSVSMEVLAESLVAKMGRPIDLPPRTEHRYEKRLCNWIVSNALQSAGRTWIVLDGFDDPDLDRGTAALIQELTREVLSGELNRRVRIVLLDFRSNLVHVDAAQISHESLPDPGSIQAADLKACLQQHFDDIGQSVDGAFLTALASKLLSDADTQRSDPQFAAEPRLKLLNQRLYQLRQLDLQRMGRNP
jgi:hypothetical protein